MTNVIQNVYPKDLTMTLMSNHIERETKEFTTAEDRIFVPDGGPFFSQSLILKNSNGVLLKPELEYKLLYLNEQATLDAGRDVVSVIWILKDTIASVELDYRVVGGEYGNTVNAIMQEIYAAGPIQKNVDWNVNVYGKPTQFPPAPHFHTPDTFTGWTMIYEQLEGIRKAIISGDTASWESHYNYINRLVNITESNLNGMFNNYPTLAQMATSINGVDTSVDLSNYYIRSEIDSKLLLTNNNVTTIADNLSVNYYNKITSDSRFAKVVDIYNRVQSDGKYALKTDYYTKTQSDVKYLTLTNLTNYITQAESGQLETRLNSKIDTVYQSIPDMPDLSNYYTTSQTYSKPEVYAKSETYSKVEIDSNIFTKTQSDVRYYSKTESDSLFVKLSKLQEEISKMSTSGQSYKIGDVYVTTVNHANSAAVTTHLGYGTWQRYAEGRTIVGLSTITTDPIEYKTMGTKFGENAHKLTVEEMPAHSHDRRILRYNVDADLGGGDHTVYNGLEPTNIVGGDKPHNNIQPSIVAGAWIRVG